jgi:hypothetical protein
VIITTQTTGAMEQPLTISIDSPDRPHASSRQRPRYRATDVQFISTFTPSTRDSKRRTQ